LSTLGVRAVKEQTSVGSSLFAQPLMLQAVPLAGEPGAAGAANSPEERAAHTLAALEAKAAKTNDLALLSDHLSLLRRWYYRPEKQRTGEIFIPNDDGGWPVRRILRGAARMVLGEPKALPEVQREAAKKVKTRILHEGRSDVERTVPVLPKRPGTAEDKTIGEVEQE
jgi:excinuclease ABC subunit C